MYASLGVVAWRWKKTPEIIEEIKKLMEHETAGDPITGLKWTRRTTRGVADQLAKLGIRVDAKTVGRLLKEFELLPSGQFQKDILGLGP